MLRSIAPPNNLKSSGKNYSSGFFCSFYWASLIFLGIYGTVLSSLMLLTTTAKKKTLFAGIPMKLRALLINGPPSHMCKKRPCKVENLICAYIHAYNLYYLSLCGLFENNMVQYYNQIPMY